MRISVVHRRMTDEECMYAVHDILQDGKHHSLTELMENATFVPLDGDADDGGDYPDDLSETQIRRGLSVLQDVLEDGIFWSGVCHEFKHENHFMSWVYQETQEVKLGQEYSARRLRIAARDVKKAVKSLRQAQKAAALAGDTSPGLSKQMRDSERHLIRGSHTILPVLSSLAAEQGMSDAVIDRMLDRLLID